MSGKKIAFIGAGSYGFTFKLVADILSFDVLMDSEFAFMDVDQGRLDNLRILLTEYFKKVGYGKKPIYTLNMQEALEGANFVINLVKIGFLEASMMDMDVPKNSDYIRLLGIPAELGASSADYAP